MIRIQKDPHWFGPLDPDSHEENRTGSLNDFVEDMRKLGLNVLEF